MFCYSKTSISSKGITRWDSCKWFWHRECSVMSTIHVYRCWLNLLLLVIDGNSQINMIWRCIDYTTLMLKVCWIRWEENFQENQWSDEKWNHRTVKIRIKSQKMHSFELEIYSVFSNDSNYQWYTKAEKSTLIKLQRNDFNIFFRLWSVRSDSVKSHPLIMSM